MLPATTYEVTDSFGRTRLADSINEYNFALALHAEGKRFWFQYEVQGGHSLKGGAVVDFLVYNPFREAVDIEAAYWHRDTADERFRDAIVEAFLGRPIIKVTDTETETVEAARRAVKRYL